MEYRQDELSEVLNIFQQESAEIIESIDEKLLHLESNQNNPELMMQLFRDAHSLKGSARMLGFEDIQNITHKIEDIISLIKDGKITVTSELTDTISETMGFILDLINKTVERKEEYKSAETQKYIKNLENITKTSALEFQTNPIITISPEKKHFLQEFNKIETIIINILYIISNARDQENYDNIYLINQQIKNFLSSIQKIQNDDFNKIKKDAREILTSIEQFNTSPNKKLSFLGVNSAVVNFVEGVTKYIDKEKIQRKDYWEIVDKKISAEKNEGNLAFSSNNAISSNPPSNTSSLSNISLNNENQKGTAKNSIEKGNIDKTTTELSQKDILNHITNTQIKTLRIDSHKLDSLVGQIGELIISKIKTNEQLSLAKKINNDLIDWQKNFLKMSYYIKYFDKKYLSDPILNPQNPVCDIQKIIAHNKQLAMLTEAHQERIMGIIKEMSNLFRQLQESEVKLNTTTAEIENMVKNMRILPLSTIFQLFPRMVHNIARDKNKKIELFIDGQEITADKTIIEEIKIPLMHIIRNSIDHGIEDTEERERLGKNPIGKIEIKASHKDNLIIIDVKDDGRGLDIEKIKQKALEKRLLTPDELRLISDEELTNLIFYPGFSTEDFVTELSGRGLGLDIVNNKINQLNGRIDIFSQINEGMVVRITIPAAIATKKVFVIEELGQLWAIETSVIKTILRIDCDEIFEKDEKNYYIYNNSAIEIFTLSQILNLDKVEKNYQKYTLMIINVENSLYGVIVDRLVSDQEIVHKKLAPPLYKVKHISGITTLANGDACLILSIEDIIATITAKKMRKIIKIGNINAKTKDNSSYKILVVDDSQTTRMLQKNIISNRGYNVITAVDPLDALDKVKKIKFDLIVSDVNMPHMSGFEFIGRLRKIHCYKNIPVIVISSEQKEKYLDEIEQTRILTYIQKNRFRQEVLLSYIEDALN